MLLSKTNCWRANSLPTVHCLLLTLAASAQVALKLLGQHAEPQHISYLLSRAPRKSLGDLSLEQIITFIMGTDVRLTLPLQTVEKLKEVRTAALTPPPPWA
jgi:hypothetical protein